MFRETKKATHECCPLIQIPQSLPKAPAIWARPFHGSPLGSMSFALTRNIDIACWALFGGFGPLRHVLFGRKPGYHKEPLPRRSHHLVPCSSMAFGTRDSYPDPLGAIGVLESRRGGGVYFWDHPGGLAPSRSGSSWRSGSAEILKSKCIYII